jgi:polyhydroxyalkanoate synthesis regulator phasin
MTEAIAACGSQRREAQAGHDAQAEASWRERALNAEDALKTAHAEIGTQRERIGILLGQIRDLQAEYTQDTVQRITTESATLKRRVRELADDNRGLSEKLQAARSNNRFLDKRVADLEAELLAAVDAP